VRLSLFDFPTCVGLRYGRRVFFATRLFLAPTPVTSGLAARLRLIRSREGFPSPLPRLSALAPPSIWRLSFMAASPLHSNSAVPDCLPVVHHLRLPASAKARLTRRGLAFRRKPQVFGAYGSHTCFRYSCRHSRFSPLHEGSPFRFFKVTTLPY
jgi:hypothetical protein